MAKLLLTILAALLLPAASALSAGDPFRSSGSGGLLAQPEFLPVEQAYRLEPRLQDGRILLDWRIAPGYYLYANQFSVQSLAGGTRIPLKHEIALGDARRIYDEYYEQELEVFYDRVLLRVDAPTAVRRPTLAVTSQGCADAGLCYPPQTQYLAIDLDTGEHVWWVVNADTPEHVARRLDLDPSAIPRTGKPLRSMLLSTASLLFAGEGFGGDPVLRALDKDTGAIVAEIALPASATGHPVSYLHAGRQYVLVAVGST